MKTTRGSIDAHPSNVLGQSIGNPASIARVTHPSHRCQALGLNWSRLCPRLSRSPVFSGPKVDGGSPSRLPVQDIPAHWAGIKSTIQQTQSVPANRFAGRAQRISQCLKFIPVHPSHIKYSWYSCKKSKNSGMLGWSRKSHHCTGCDLSPMGRDWRDPAIWSEEE